MTGSPKLSLRTKTRSRRRGRGSGRRKTLLKLPLPLFVKNVCKQIAAAEVLNDASDPKRSGGSSDADESENDSAARSLNAEDHDENSNSDNSDSSDEEGQLSEVGSRGVAGDVLEARASDGTFGGGRLRAGSRLETFVERTLEKGPRRALNHPATSWVTEKGYKGL